MRKPRHRPHAFIDPDPDRKTRHGRPGGQKDAAEGDQVAAAPTEETVDLPKRAISRNNTQHKQIERWITFAGKLPLPDAYQSLLDAAGWHVERLQEIQPMLDQFTQALAQQKETKVAYYKVNRACAEQGDKMHRWRNRYTRLLTAALGLTRFCRHG